jgi:hypothetical protein
MHQADPSAHHLARSQPAPQLPQPALQAHQQFPQSYQQIPQSYQQVPQFHQVPQFQHAPQSHQQIPQFYQHTPQSYQQAPASYQTTPSSPPPPPMPLLLPPPLYSGARAPEELQLSYQPAPLSHPPPPPPPYQWARPSEELPSTWHHGYQAARVDREDLPGPSGVPRVLEPLATEEERWRSRHCAPEPSTAEQRWFHHDEHVSPKPIIRIKDDGSQNSSPRENPPEGQTDVKREGSLRQSV